MAANVIKCADGNDVLFRKINLEGCSSSTVIIVPDTHNAIILRDGIAYETLSSGRHKIFDKKSNSYDYSIANSQAIEVIFISKTAKLNLLWGTTTQYDMRDPNTNVSIKLGASGELEIQISNPRKAYLELIGQNEGFNLDDLKNRIQGRLLAEVQYQISNIMNEKKLSYDRLGEVLLPVGNEILPHIAKMFEEDYGLKIFSFTISRIIIDDEDIQKIDNARSARGKQIQEKESREYKEHLDEVAFRREIDLRRLEREDYDKYLEICKVAGWPQSPKKATEKDGKECPNCGVKITGDMKFCPVCGLELVKNKIKCPNCGKMITKEDMFCKHCGAKVKG